MIKAFILFLIVFSIFFFGITKLKKVDKGIVMDALYAILCAVLTVSVLGLFVILF